MTSLQIRNESDRNKAMGYIAGLDLAKPKKLAITEVDRSGEQNKALHAALADIAAQVAQRIIELKDGMVTSDCTQQRASA